MFRISVLRSIDISGVEFIILVDYMVHQVSITLVVQESHHVWHRLVNPLQRLGILDFSHLVLLLLDNVQNTVVDYVEKRFQELPVVSLGLLREHQWTPLRLLCIFVSHFLLILLHDVAPSRVAADSTGSDSGIDYGDLCGAWG